MLLHVYLWYVLREGHFMFLFGGMYFVANFFAKP